MPFVADRHEHCLGQMTGTGHCVAFVRELTGAPITTQWRRGAKARELVDLVPGTAIATFDSNGRYGGHPDARSHCALLLAIHDDGLLVADQWTGQPVHQRAIRFRGGTGDPANDGDAFFVIEMQA